jgi:hypothetical protein
MSKISDAEKACNKVHAAWNKAEHALSGGVGINGYGIYHDQAHPLFLKLYEAEKQIQIALKELKAIDWPTDADYDAYEKNT